MKLEEGKMWLEEDIEAATVFAGRLIPNITLSGERTGNECLNAE